MQKYMLSMFSVLLFSAIMLLGCKIENVSMTRSCTGMVVLLKRRTWNRVWMRVFHEKQNGSGVLKRLSKEIYHFIFILFNFYFIDYVPTAVLIFSICPPPPSTPHSLRQSPHHCSCPWVMPISSLASPFPMLYFTALWLFCLYFLIPSSLHPFPYTSLPSGSHQNTLCIHDSVSVFLVCLVVF